MKQKAMKIITQNCFFTIPQVSLRKFVIAQKADIYCFQEITTRRFIKSLNTRLRYNVAFSTPSRNLHVLSFQNVIMSRFPIVSTGEFMFSKSTKVGFDPLGGRVLWARISTPEGVVKIYNCHFSPIGQGMEERSSMLKLISHDASKWNGPTIICGDMNTAVPGSRFRKIVKLWSKFPDPDVSRLGKYAYVHEKYYFYDTAKRNGFFELADINDYTWRMFVLKNRFRMKLDWMLYHKLRPVSYAYGPWIGDHRAIIGELGMTA